MSWVNALAFLGAEAGSRPAKEPLEETTRRCRPHPSRVSELAATRSRAGRRFNDRTARRPFCPLLRIGLGDHDDEIWRDGRWCERFDPSRTYRCRSGARACARPADRNGARLGHRNSADELAGREPKAANGACVHQVSRKEERRERIITECRGARTNRVSRG